MADHKVPALSRPMLDAINLARQNGDKLKRYPGGFWIGANEASPYTAKSFGTPTVEALVKRGVAEYTEWKDGRSGRFPIEVTLRLRLPTISDDDLNSDALLRGGL